LLGEFPWRQTRKKEIEGEKIRKAHASLNIRGIKNQKEDGRKRRKKKVEGEDYQNRRIPILQDGGGLINRNL
jgi:hypothetical protein